MPVSNALFSPIVVPDAAALAPLADGVAAVGSAPKFAREDHVHPTDATLLAKAGGTMTGPLTLSGNASAALHAVTKQQMDVREQGVVYFADHQSGTGATSTATIGVSNLERVVWNSFGVNNASIVHANGGFTLPANGLYDLEWCVNVFYNNPAQYESGLYNFSGATYILQQRNRLMPVGGPVVVTGHRIIAGRTIFKTIGTPVIVGIVMTSGWQNADLYWKTSLFGDVPSQETAQWNRMIITRLA